VDRSIRSTYKEEALKRKGGWSLQPFVIRNIVTIKESSPSISKGEVAKAVGASHPSVGKVLNQARQLGLSASELESMTDSDISDKFYSLAPGRHGVANKVEPDFATVLKELEAGKRQNLTRYLLWCEYENEVGEDHAYGYSSFCEKLARFDESKEISMVLHHALR
jgi:hypothetical protein